MGVSKLSGFEKQLLKAMGKGHPDRRLDVFYRGEIYPTAPFTWGELSARTKAADDAIADAVAALVAAGAVDSARQPTRFFRWIRRSKPTTFFFITRQGKRWLAESDPALTAE